MTFAGLLAHSRREFPLSWSDRRPCLGEDTDTTSFDRHYVYHTAWAARMLEQKRPSLHVDISSSLYFSAIVSAFIPVHFFDFRPAELTLDNVTLDRADLLALPFADGSIVSLSCMHVIEHVGLGRYGDHLDPDGDIKAANELQRVMAPDGFLYLVVPVGKPKINFNAHRVYPVEQILDLFSPMVLVEFTLVPDDPAVGGLIRNATFDLADAQNYGCGCFLFKMPSSSRSEVKRRE